MGDRAENEFSSRTLFHRARSHHTRFTVLAYLSATTLSGNIPLGLFTIHVEYPPSIQSSSRSGESMPEYVYAYSVGRDDVYSDGW